MAITLSQQALSFYSSPVIATPARTSVAAISLLLPLNFLGLALIRERGFTTPAIASRLFFIFLQSVFVAVMCRADHAASGSWLTASLINPKWCVWTRIPQLALLAFAVTFGFLLARVLLYSKAADNGSLWALLAVAIALDSGSLGRNGTAYLGTAALMLTAAVVETSYFMAYHDELTRLPGRRAFNELLLGLEDRYAIAIVDVDHFKNFNDTYGHETGDDVLRMVAAKLDAVNGGGKAFRCGGEEFAIVFAGMSCKDAWEHVEEVRKIIENSSFRVRGQLDRRHTPRPGERRQPNGKKMRQNAIHVGHEVSVTVSIGVAEPSTMNRKVDQVIQAADKALYRAKEGGRNRVELDRERARMSRARGTA